MTTEQLMIDLGINPNTRKAARLLRNCLKYYQLQKYAFPLRKSSRVVVPALNVLEALLEHRILRAVKASGWNVIFCRDPRHKVITFIADTNELGETKLIEIDYRELINA